MILAAGEGTRLRPLTFHYPKPLLPLLNRPLLEWILNYLGRFGVERVVLNTHHLAEAFETSLSGIDRGNLQEVSLRFEPHLLNTGGGLVQVRDFFRSDPFLVISGDILTDIDLFPALKYHRRHGGPVTLILHDYPEFNQIEVDPHGRIRKFRKGDGRGLDFANIHILDRSVFSLLPPSGVFDIITAYQEIIDQGIPIQGYISRNHYWRNIGTPDSYWKAHEECLFGNGPAYVSSALHPMTQARGALVHPTARLAADVLMEGWACIGKDCRIGSGCLIRRSILFEEVETDGEITISQSIVGKGVHVSRSLEKEILL